MLQGGPPDERIALGGTSQGNVYRAVRSTTPVASVPSGNRTTDFQLSYTITAADAALGKVNFRAVAASVLASSVVHFVRSPRV